MLLAQTSACAALAEADYEVVEEQVGGAVLDADLPTQRYVIRACYAGPGDPLVELELSPWIEAGEGEVEVVFESDPELGNAVDDRRGCVN